MSNEHITISFFYLQFQPCAKNIFEKFALSLARKTFYLPLFSSHLRLVSVFLSCLFKSNCISFFGFLLLSWNECIVSFYDEHLIRNKFFIFIFNSSCAFVPVWSSFFQLSFTLHEVVKILTTNHLIFAVYDK